jgi:hypothetical protein
MRLTGKGAFAGIGAAVVAALVGLVAHVFTVSNGETRYQRPGPAAGAQAQAAWDFYWTGTDFKDPDDPVTGEPGKWHSNRCYFPLIGAQAPPFMPIPPPCVKPKMCVPRSTTASGVWQPAIYACANHPDGCYRDQAGTEQPVRLSKVGYIFGIGSAHGACIVDARGVCDGLGDQCPIQPPPPVTKTPTLPPTPPGPTPACVPVTVTPQTICVTPTPVPR